MIQNWKDVVQNETLTEKANMEFILEAEGIVFARFLVGTSGFETQSLNVGFYWKLLSMHDYLDQSQNKLSMEVLNNSGRVARVFEVFKLLISVKFYIFLNIY